MNPRPLLRRLRDRRRRRLLKALLGAALVIAGVLVPLEPANLPAPLADPGGGSAALAQTVNPPYVTLGTPTPCPPAPWVENDSLCVLQTAACPKSPLPGGKDLELSVGYNDPDNPGLYEYPGFCEDRVVEPPGPTYTPEEQAVKDRYDACVAGVGGFVREQYSLPGPPVVPGCRLIRGATCATGLHRVDSNTCRAIQRRTWDCADGYIPRNDFNTCYQEPPPPSGSGHPACGDGAPDLVVQSCPDYVGNDYERTPLTVDCPSFLNLTGKDMANIVAGTSGKYWCEFDTSWLKVVCHSATPPAGECAASPANCLKRASLTGGCYAIADIIHCRALQADYDAGAKTIDDLRNEQCAPCLILPFQGLPPGCPDDVAGVPTTFIGTAPYRTEYPVEDPDRAAIERPFITLHRVEDDYSYLDLACLVVYWGGADLADHAECQKKPVCQDPPRGRVTWQSTHASQHAVVNAPVIFTVFDVPTSMSEVKVLNYQYAKVTGSLREYLAYPTVTPDDPIIRAWPKVDEGTTYSSVVQLVDSGECVLRDPPRYRITIEELWPDNAEARIDQWFGADALNWWRKLSTDEKRRRTLARGLSYWDDLDAAGQADERTRRERDLTEEVICNVLGRIWCRWSPTRSGYYLAKADGAWRVDKYNVQRSWVRMNRLQSDLGAIRNELSSLLDQHNVSAAEAGVSNDLMSLLPRASTSTEWLYSSSAGKQYLCPGTDIRVRCTNTNRTGNFTESEPIGIVVHEMRVATRVPAR